MKRALLHPMTLIAVVVVVALVSYSYFKHAAVNQAKQAYDLLGEEKLEEALKAAEYALWYDSSSVMGYYVRGIARFKLQPTHKANLKALAQSKADLLRTLELTDNDIIVKNCKDFLGQIKILEEWHRRPIAPMAD